jgi:hypothetical protein
MSDEDEARLIQTHKHLLYKEKNTMKQNSEHMKFTYADLQTLPEDGKRYELFDGELIMTPAPFPHYQDFSPNLSSGSKSPSFKSYP